VETQAENNDTQRAEKIAASLEAKPDPKKDEKAKKAKSKKKKEPEPTKEDIQAAVAGVVLAEMKFWPEQVVALVGEQHPNKDSFLKGVAYVIGGYMHFARKALDHVVAKRKREAELKTCGLLSPITQELRSLREEHNKARDTAVADLQKERREKLEEARKAINEEYDAKIAEAQAVELPSRAKDLMEQEATIHGAYEGACATIDKEAKALRDQIQEIEDAKEDWNSKKRKARRAANCRKDGVQDEEAVE
jgi:hypothetical protein